VAYGDEPAATTKLACQASSVMRSGRSLSKLSKKSLKYA
jgi:hypothetical protein